MIVYPSAHSFTLYPRQIELHGGSFTSPHNLRIDGVIDLFLDTIQVRVFGADPFPTLYRKATVLAWKIVTEHPFHDGNKRTGLATAITFLKLNGKRLHATGDEIVDVALQVAQTYENGFGEDDLELWFYRHT